MAVTRRTPRPAEADSAPMVSVSVPPAREPWYSKTPPAKPAPWMASAPKVSVLAFVMTSEPLPEAAVGRNWSVPPATVTLPVKFTIVPKVSAVAPATAVAMELLRVTVVPLTPVTMEPAGIFVPDTVMPGMMPVALLTKKLLVWAAPPLATVMPVGAVLA